MKTNFSLTLFFPINLQTRSNLSNSKTQNKFYQFYIPLTTHTILVLKKPQSSSHPILFTNKLSWKIGLYSDSITSQFTTIWLLPQLQWPLKKLFAKAKNLTWAILILSPHSSSTLMFCSMWYSQWFSSKTSLSRLLFYHLLYSLAFFFRTGGLFYTVFFSVKKDAWNR